MAQPRRGGAMTVVGLAAGLAMHALAAAVQDDGTLSGFSPRGRAEIRTGAAVVEVPRSSGPDVAILGAVRTTAHPDRLVDWSREIAELQRGKYVPLIGRFSSQPRLEDLASLTLDEEELEDLRDCRPRHCHVKLSAAEMHQMSAAVARARQGWRPAALETFRAIVLARARAFEHHGFRRVPPYEDDKQPVDPAAEFSLVLDRFAGDALFTPSVAQYLRSHPASAPGVESFLNWSKDLLGDAKPIISITHLAIVSGRSGEPTIVAASQVFATHYLNASLSLTAIDTPPGEDAPHLLYTRRSRVDVFDGAFGGIVRRLVMKRVRAEGPSLLEGFRRNLERGIPAVRRTTDSAIR